jgi:hypothetical protein
MFQGHAGPGRFLGHFLLDAAHFMQDFGFFVDFHIIITSSGGWMRMGR